MVHPYTNQKLESLTISVLKNTSRSLPEHQEHPLFREMHYFSVAHCPALPLTELLAK